ncbi:MAG: terminase small subunit [Deltaproteobacteria bacterium]|nr:terminase small subunit [Deltaproteobacteria bacterium]
MNLIRLTAKQEKFCQCITEGLNQSDAYRTAYSAATMKPATIHSRAAELMQNSKIAVRIDELRAPVILECRLTLHNHLQTLEQLRDIAKASGNISAAIRAEELRGRACGLYVEHRENKTEVGMDLSDDEINEKLAVLLGTSFPSFPLELEQRVD